MKIRSETKKDYEAVNQVVKQAFATAPHRDGNEQELVASLRTSSAFIPGLSLVAEFDGKIVGHILLTEASVGKHTVLALAPLSVLPDFQGRGIGTALIQEGHRTAQKLGYSHCLVLGNPAYYARTGYRPAAQFGIQAPAGIPAANLMAIALQETAAPLCGTVCYAKEFGILP